MVINNYSSNSNLRRFGDYVFTAWKIPRTPDNPQERSSSFQRIVKRLSSLGTNRKGYFKNSCGVLIFCDAKYGNNDALLYECKKRKI